MPNTNINPQINIKPVEHIEEFLAKKLSEQQKHIIDLLNTFSKDCIEIYKASLFIYFSNDFPARQSILAHCLIELTNAITRRAETRCKHQFTDAIMNLEFVKDGNWGKDVLDREISKLWKDGGATKLQNEEGKFKSILKERRPTMKENDIEAIVKKVKSDKSNLQKLKHFNAEFHKIDNDQFDKYVNTIEEFIICLEEPYGERKEGIDAILEAANKR